MKPWREVIIPHTDVLKGTIQQSEFAADISAVQNGKATTEYQDPIAFFERTFITQGMASLLTQVAKRLAGKDGDPVIQLQTAFGGGKTHSMLAVYHLSTRKCRLSELSGISQLMDKAGLLTVPEARVAVIDGTAHSPGQPWKKGRITIKTLWGELAWQLGGADGFSLVKEADSNGTSPGKEVLRELLANHSPCVVLMDELVAYVRQFPEGQSLTGGTYDSNLSFVHALTEAVKLVPNAVVLASLPESEIEAGSSRGIGALKALEKTFGRVQALWKPVGTEESFEIVRRRLFEPVKDLKERDLVCKRFAETYEKEGAKLPSEVHEAHYLDRLCQAYPIHPEFFDRLFEDWTTIEGFQRTRGVLKLMAKVIGRLWRDNNQDLLILPGSLPLHDGEVRNDLTYLLQPGWDAVIEKDIDGDRAETTALEARETRLGQVNAARRVARTLFLGSAPSSVATKASVRGLDRGRVLLGCLQPEQPSALYADALSRLVDRLHYLNASGDKVADTTRFWFDTRANLRREMEDRKRRVDDQTDVRRKIEETIKKLYGSISVFDGVHVFTPHADVPDDSALRLVVLPPEQWFMKDMARQADDAAQEILRSHGNQPRHRANRLLFLAADNGALARLKDLTRTALAWESIVDDVKQGKLNIDNAQQRQAESEAKSAGDVLPRAARDCYKWLLCPNQEDPRSQQVTLESFSVPNSNKGASEELVRVCLENELVIETWAAVHLRSKLREFYWKPDKPAVEAKTFWEDSLRYLFMPRLKSRNVLSGAISEGSTNKDYFGTAVGLASGRYDAFQFGDGNVSYSDSLLLIEPDAARVYAESTQVPPLVLPQTGTKFGTESPPQGSSGGPAISGTPTSFPTGGKGSSFDTGGVSTGGSAQKWKTFRGAVEVNPTLAKSRLHAIATEIIELLTNDPNAEVRIILEIDAEFPMGATDTTKRNVSENANSLGFKTKDWE